MAFCTAELKPHASHFQDERRWMKSKRISGEVRKRSHWLGTSVPNLDVKRRMHDGRMEAVLAESKEMVGD
jgi:hypothetical protein